MSDTNKLPFALGAADAFLRTAEMPYAQLSERWRIRKAGGQAELVSNPGELAPLISNVAFGIELLLKVIRIQDSSKAPRGHNLSDLFNPLDNEIKQSLTLRYVNHLANTKLSDDAPYVLFQLQKSTRNIDVSPAPTIDIALINMNRSFETWRYIYELETQQSGVLYFNFFESIALAKALRHEISEFTGSAKVTLVRA